MIADSSWIQIDGLSRIQLQRAIEDGRMPFLKSLLDREHYEVQDFYSWATGKYAQCAGGAILRREVRGSGVRFQDHRSGEIVRMFARDITADVERANFAPRTWIAKWWECVLQYLQWRSR